MAVAKGSCLELNLTPHDLLTAEDMVTLTGTARADIQAQVLAANNIFFMLDNKLQPKTTWFHVNNPIHLRTPTLSMSDFGYGFTKSFQMKPDAGYNTSAAGKDLQKKIYGFLDKVFGNLDAQIPAHIKDQIARAEQNQKHMADIAELRRREEK